MRTFFLVCIHLIACLPEAMHAREPEPFRVAVVMSEQRDEYDQALEGLKETLKAEIETYNFHRSSQRIPPVIDAVKKSRPHLIIAFGSSAYKIIKKRVEDVPLMFSMVAYPEKYCKENEYPFGISLLTDPYVEMEFVRELFGDRKRMGIVYNPDISWRLIERQKKAARQVGIEIVARPVHSEKESYEAIDRLKNEVDLFYLIPDPAMASARIFERLKKESYRRHIPIVGFSGKYLEKDCIATISADYRVIGRTTGQRASTFLRTKVNLGICYPKKARIQVNPKAAKLLKFKIPDAVWSKAEVYE